MDLWDYSGLIGNFEDFLFLEKILVGSESNTPVFSMERGGKWILRVNSRTVKYFDREEHHFTSFRSILPFTPYPKPFPAKIPKDRQVPIAIISVLRSLHTSWRYAKKCVVWKESEL